jgi:hypothetical protein
MLHHENQFKNKKSMQSLPENGLSVRTIIFFVRIIKTNIDYLQANNYFLHFFPVR